MVLQSMFRPISLDISFLVLYFYTGVLADPVGLPWTQFISNDEFKVQSKWPTGCPLSYRHAKNG